jgi:hypothetical protein
LPSINDVASLTWNNILNQGSWNILFTCHSQVKSHWWQVQKYLCEVTRPWVNVIDLLEDLSLINVSLLLYTGPFLYAVNLPCLYMVSLHMTSLLQKQLICKDYFWLKL